jgi:hypothetical protein
MVTALFRNMPIYTLQHVFATKNPLSAQHCCSAAARLLQGLEEFLNRNTVNYHLSY